jgi:glucose/arabinose dehydrogenase
LFPFYFACSKRYNVKKIIFFSFIISCLSGSMSSCHHGAGGAGDFSADTAVIAGGKASFTQYCGGCHTFKKSSIGPSLGGVTDTVPAEWIRHFIRSPQELLGAGDQRASQLYRQYKVMMPGFGQLTEDEMSGILSYLHTQKGMGSVGGKVKGEVVQDPIPGGIRFSGLVVGMRLVTQFPRSTDSGRTPLARITKMDFEPGTGRDFVVDLRGRLYRMDKGVPAVYMDMAVLRPNFIHEPRVATGFGSFAFHPDFARNGLLYTSHSEHAGSGRADFGYADSIGVALQWVVTEWKVRDPAAKVFSGEGRELLRVNMVTSMHGVQELAFNPLSARSDRDYGKLYICVGDGDCIEEGYGVLTHSKEKVWGTILRIDPAGHNSFNGRYGIPADNPFIGDAGGRQVKEIYAYGFRNPHRITWTRDGKMLAVNIGQTNIESVCWIMPGHDYGWPVREGNFVLDPDGDLDKIYTLPPDDSLYHFTYPIAEYDHDEGKAICGGFEYTGNDIPALKGKFVFGDIVNGRLFYIGMKDIVQGKQASVKEWRIAINGRPVTLLQLCGDNRADLHFGKDAKGELYILTKTDGKIYRLTDGVIKDEITK